MNRSASFLAVDPPNPRLHQLLNKCSRQRLVDKELDGPFGRREGLKLVLKLFDHRGRRKQTAMVRKRREPHQYSFVPNRWDLIADGLSGLGRHSGPNRRAEFPKIASCGFRDTCKVFIDVLRSAFAFRRRPAFASFSFFHARNATSTLLSSPRVCATARANAGALAAP